jgi:hypothetical protein
MSNEELQTVPATAAAAAAAAAETVMKRFNGELRHELGQSIVEHLSTHDVEYVVFLNDRLCDAIP